MQVHCLKIRPEYLKEIVAGTKLFEIRQDDRGYRVGDFLILREFSEDVGYTGAALAVSVTYITTYAQAVGFIVMGIRKLDGGKP